MVRYITENDEETLYESVPAAHLVLVVNGRSGQSYPLRGTIHLGRDKSNSVVVADKKVSRHHATLSPVEDTFILIDQGSANGTYLNGVLISQPTRLKPKDRLMLGDTEFLFVVDLPEQNTLVDASVSSRPFNLPGNLLPNQTSSSQTPVWLVIGCAGAVIISLLLVVAVMVGMLLGRSQPVGWLVALLAGLI